jgi:hypothetical protein
LSFSHLVPVSPDDDLTGKGLFVGLNIEESSSDPDPEK